jgi:triosephosphate isomerase
MGGAILATLKELYSDKALDVPLLYGGSMNGSNAGEFAAQDCIHGGLVGGAALQADSFLEVAASVAAAKA